MCDIYTGNCEGCGAEIDVHIGDFSVARSHVRIFCPHRDCRMKMLNVLVGRHSNNGVEYGGQNIVFSDGLVSKNGAWIFIVPLPRQIAINDLDEEEWEKPKGGELLI